MDWHRYKRIIDRNAELGVSHIVFAPTNSDLQNGDFFDGDGASQGSGGLGWSVDTLPTQTRFGVGASASSRGYCRANGRGRPKCLEVPCVSLPFPGAGNSHMDTGWEEVLWCVASQEQLRVPTHSNAAAEPQQNWLTCASHGTQRCGAIPPACAVVPALRFPAIPRVWGGRDSAQARGRRWPGQGGRLESARDGKAWPLN